MSFTAVGRIDMGYTKALTFSYDDGVTQDIRLAEMFRKYGLKATFNLNSQLLGEENSLERGGVVVNHTKVRPEEVAQVYKGHEVAVHTLTHPRLSACTKEEVIRQVEEDRKVLSKLVGYEVVGMAYPCGGVNNNDEVAQIIKENTGVQYARTITSTFNFEPQENLYRFNPSVYHIMEMEQLFQLGEQFLAMKPDRPQIFYVWGHSYEFDIRDTWGDMERFCQMMSGKEDIFYGTNREVLLGDWT